MNSGDPWSVIPSDESRWKRNAGVFAKDQGTGVHHGWVQSETQIIHMKLNKNSDTNHLPHFYYPLNSKQKQIYEGKHFLT